MNMVYGHVHESCFLMSNMVLDQQLMVLRRTAGQLLKGGMNSYSAFCEAYSGKNDYFMEEKN